ncbi:MAG: FAD binding domain-containing protein [Methylobacteriaceae bacterium]|nr:FAD binding domain-containing protein [Methylobacteriaceae bacterium]MBV9395576.1 FAD binding domain-containing protein [Methylobacteriaceae bacterium]
MKPARFDYERPRELGAALALLAGDNVTTKVLAGGQSLGPLLNLRLVQPDIVVDITAIPEMIRVEEEADHLVLGACITHADIEDGRVPDVTNGAMRDVAAGIAYRAVRNRGTIGGSLTSADPSADWVSALAALGAEVILRGATGTRTLPVEDYVVGALETSLGTGELLETVRIPRLSKAARWAYVKKCRKTGEFAHAIGAVLVDPERNVWRAVIGATESRPIVAADARELFGGRGDAAALNTFDARIADRILINAGMSDALDRQIHVVALRRAVAQAAETALQ